MATLHSRFVSQILRFFSGSTDVLDIDPAGYVDVKQPGGLKLAGTSVTATAADLNNVTNAAGAGQTFPGSTSGNTTLKATAIASGTLTLPAATDTLVGKATTDTLTNKTLTSPAISGPTISGITSTVQQKRPSQALTSSAAATPVNAALGDFCLMSLTENTTVGAPTNPVDGQILVFKITNTASNRTVAWNAAFHFVGSSAPTITVGAKDSVVAFIYDAATSVWNELYRNLNE